ncbi:Fanconi anemia core complex-associated protein 20 [Willisornis vidua]|uniref:Fanconi anemia core complex-associated protein 20 n=1 Tax=Willisornis vidua TaxID=1566151 RepID=A0ABQ9DGD6_9PASS|nr:Fanconi anemia core complex-associated protein 20 [Willisornis vidua]
MKDFQWVPFPPFHKEKHLNPKDLSSQQPTQSQSHESHPGQGQADKLCSLPSTAEKTCRGIDTDQAKTAVVEDTKGISTLEVSPESHKLPGHRSSAQPMAQSSIKAFSSQQHHTEAAQNRGENREGSGRKELQIQPPVGNIPAGQDRWVPAEKPGGSVPGAESCEKMENQSEGSSALDSCPMCLMQFSGTLSQLDIDGHLARCLSESAEDVMW